MIRIALAAGGTAGHVYPAVALADALVAIGAPVEALFVGTPAGLERELLGDAGRELHLIPGLPFQCRGAVAQLRALWSMKAAFAQARRFLRERRVDAVVGFGGYASIGPVVAARSLGLPAALVDGNADLGLANRVLAPLVQRRYVRSIPVRKEILASAPPHRRGQTIVVFGDAFLDVRVPQFLGGIAAERALRILHRSTATPPDEIRAAYGPEAEVTVVRHISDVAAAYHDAALVIARGGASTLAELAITGRPSVIVPLAAASEDHQSRNARVYAARGAAIVVDERKWQADVLCAAVEEILDSRSVWQRMSDAARELARPHTATDIARDLLMLCGSLAPATRGIPIASRLEGVRG